MTTFSQHVEDYLRLRRSFGYKLDEAARLLPRFAARLDAAGAEFVTIDLALAWALEPEVAPGSVVPSVRLLVVRGFARYMAGVERRTEIPPAGLIPFRRRRRAPFIYSDADVAALMEQARRDRAMLILTLQAGLRVSEMVAVNCGDVTLGTGGHVRVEGKGRKQRAVPLTTQAKAVLAVWLAERGLQPDEPLFPTRTGRRLSRDAVERRVATHVAAAAERCTSLNDKQIHPHVLRHSCAMSLLHAGVDSTVIALWLGHADVRSTQPYIHADMTIKERALALVTPTTVAPGRYVPIDDVLAFLDSLK